MADLLETNLQTLTCHHEISWLMPQFWMEKMSDGFCTNKMLPQKKLFGMVLQYKTVTL